MTGRPGLGARLRALWGWLNEDPSAVTPAGARPRPPGAGADSAGPAPGATPGPAPVPARPLGPVGRLADAVATGAADPAREALDEAVAAGLAPEARQALEAATPAGAPPWQRLLAADAILAADPEAGRRCLQDLAGAEAPDLAIEARLRLGDLCRGAGDLAGARLHYERVLALDIDQPRARALADALRAPAPGSAGDPPTVVLPRDRLGPAADRYVLLRELGRGGAGTVYLAEDVRLGRRVAVKVLHPRPGEAPPARLLAEVQTAVALVHPGIVRIFDVDADRGVVVMEHLAGGSLRDRLVPGEPLPPASVAALGRGLAGALAALHRRGIVHGDLKAANVLFRAGGSLSAPVIADFGLAREAGGGRRPAGTLAAMAPEVRRGAAPTPAADVFALGVLLHEALAGAAPFAPAAVLRGAPAAPALGPEVPGALAALLTDLVAADPGARPRDADAVLARLEAGDASETPGDEARTLPGKP